MKTSIYAVMSAIFLAIIIMGGIMVGVPASTYLVNKAQITDGVNYIISPRNQTTGFISFIFPESQASQSIAINPDTGLLSNKNHSLVVFDNANPRYFTLSGTGKLTVQANQAIIILGVFTEDKTADWAVQENALKMSDVVSALKALGISEEDIQTISYSINPVYNWELRITVGYQVTNTLQITLNDLTKIGSVIDKSSVAGANTISSVTFTVNDDDFAKFKLQAYKEAVKDVQAKAKIISEGFGFEIVGIQSINESYYYPIYRNTYTAMDMKGAEIASTPIVAGTLDISVTLNVVYLLD